MYGRGCLPFIILQLLYLKPSYYSYLSAVCSNLLQLYILAFCSLFLPSYHSKNDSSKIGASLNAILTYAHFNFPSCSQLIYIQYIHRIKITSQKTWHCNHAMEQRHTGIAHKIVNHRKQK